MYACMSIRCMSWTVNPQTAIRSFTLLLPVSVFPSVSGSERRELLVAQLQTCCPRCLMSPPRLGCAGHRGTAAAAAAPAHAQRCCPVSTATTRGWQGTGSASSVQGKGRKGGIQCIPTHTRGKRHLLTFWTFIQLPHSVGRCASCWGCKRKHRRGICFTPTKCTDIHAWRAKSCSGILTCDALSWTTSTRPGNCKRPKESRAKFHPHTRTATPEHGACCRCAPDGLRTDWVALSNSAKFHS